MNNQALDLFRDLSDRIASAPVSGLSVVVGFDAFIDENVRIVDQRLPDGACRCLPGIGDFGDWVQRAAGRSGLREFLIEEQAAGGCALNMGDGLAHMGAAVDAYIGIGEPIRPVFADLVTVFRSVQSLGMGPGRSFVMQFDDGKLIFSNTEELERVRPERLRGPLQASDYRERCGNADGVAFLSWATTAHLTECWRMVQKEVLSGLSRRPMLFFDLADPVNRSNEAIVDMLECLRQWRSIGPVVLSVNENEAEQLAAVAGGDASFADSPVSQRADVLRGLLELDELVIHAVDRAAAAAVGVNPVEVPGPHCERPRKTVGAGDRFNAGYFAGRLLGWDLGAALALGNLTSGFFVREARSGSQAELADFCRHFANGSLD